jgi:regulatory protein
MAKQREVLEKSLILQKIYGYCNYQERCIREVEQKLKTLAVQKKMIPSIINHLQTEGYIDEERYAKAFAGGKFRLNKWGKQKIEFELRIRSIPELMVQEGLNSIDQKDYLQTLKNLMIRKYDEIKSDDDENIREKIINFAYGKGYEMENILSLIKELKI